MNAFANRHIGSNSSEQSEMLQKIGISSISELVEEIKEVIQNGSRYPQFPPEANPSITYAWDLTNQEDGDCYHEIIDKLEKENRKEVIY